MRSPRAPTYRTWCNDSGLSGMWNCFTCVGGSSTAATTVRLGTVLPSPFNVSVSPGAEHAEQPKSRVQTRSLQSPCMQRLRWFSPNQLVFLAPPAAPVAFHARQNPDDGGWGCTGGVGDALEVEAWAHVGWAGDLLLGVLPHGAGGAAGALTVAQLYAGLCPAMCGDRARRARRHAAHQHRG